MKGFSFPTMSVLNAAPLVLAQYDNDFERLHADLAVALDQASVGRVAIFLQLGYEHEDSVLATRLADAVRDFLGACPRAEVTVLCNTPLEVERFAERGVKSVFCHQNAFLDESRYLLLPGRRRFDAVYLARLTPVKRHLLLEPIVSGRILLAGAKVLDHQRDYAQEGRDRLRAATIVAAFRGLDVSSLLCSACCGLMLSPREGANFATGEYALCGLPIVNTPSIGGRELLSPAAYRTDVPAEAPAIAEAIARWVKNPPDPKAVRRAFLEMAETHRETLRGLIAAFTGRRPKRFPHKLGLRTPGGGLGRAAATWFYLRQLSLRARLRALFGGAERRAE